MSNILQSSLSSAFAGLTASLKTGFADLGKLIQDSKRPEVQESGSESGDSGDEDSDKNESDEPPAKRQKAADSSPAIIEKLTKDLALEDEKGPDINVQLAGLVHKLLREAKPNETKLNELKKQYIPPNNCEGLSETRVNANIWNNLGETARSNDLKLQKVQKYLVKGMTALVTVIDKLNKDEAKSSNDDNISSLMDAVILLSNDNTEVNLRRRERLKPELHPSYRHLCNPSNPITSQLFGMTSPRLSKTLRRQIKSARSSTVKGSRQTEGIKGRDQGPLQAKTAEHPTDHTDQISLLLDQKLPAPPFSNRREGAKKKQQQEKNQ